MQTLHRRPLALTDIAITAALASTAEIDAATITGGAFGLPAASPITAVTFYGAAKPGGSYYALQDGAGNPLVTTVAAGNGYPLPVGCFGWRGLKLVATELAQAIATVVATAALPANTYNNETAGVGATLTANAHGVLTIDGHAVVLSDVVLVTDEAAPANNGLYTCTTAGAAGASYVLTRATTMDSTGKYIGAIVAVGPTGTAAANTVWRCTNATAPTVGATAIAFVAIAAVGTMDLALKG